MRRERPRVTRASFASPAIATDLQIGAGKRPETPRDFLLRFSEAAVIRRSGGEAGSHLCRIAGPLSRPRQVSVVAPEISGRMGAHCRDASDRCGLHC
ncbi:hypothetical protein BQ8482_100217 [Mesorhizobium delmotii]|uniref:Uncharacterized protein n=1 Tax=Mesorhizobium delmotii TaxID=1631247 RepID=A0A2P9AA75_9HYPH|nr:hypothetical protein BQ8482_100217 [Mesorhizobium delmotii]